MVFLLLKQVAIFRINVRKGVDPLLLGREMDKTGEPPGSDEKITFLRTFCIGTSGDQWSVLEPVFVGAAGVLAAGCALYSGHKVHGVSFVA